MSLASQCFLIISICICLFLLPCKGAGLQPVNGTVTNVSVDTWLQSSRDQTCRTTPQYVDSFKTPNCYLWFQEVNITNQTLFRALACADGKPLLLGCYGGCNISQCGIYSDYDGSCIKVWTASGEYYHLKFACDPADLPGAAKKKVSATVFTVFLLLLPFLNW